MNPVDIDDIVLDQEQTATATATFTCFNRRGLETILPHRGAALRKIDAVFYSSDDPQRMTGIKEVREDDQDLEGHFPGAPTYPGYAQDEFVCRLPPR